MEELDLFAGNDEQNRVLVTIFNPDLAPRSLEVVSTLRSKGIRAEIYLNEGAKLDKQLKFADQKGFKYAVIIGPDEAEKNQLVLKDLNAKSQTILSLEEVVQTLQS